MDEIEKHSSLIIESEEKAWEVFQSVIESDLDEKTHLVFKNWPLISIKLDGKNFNKSLTAKNMAGIIEIQKSIYRTYAVLAYNSTNINRLSDGEKESLTLIFTVDEGSSKIEAFIERQMDYIAKDLISKMEPKHYVITILGISLIVAASVGYKDWLQHQKDMFLAEQALKQKQIELDDRQFASEMELKRMELLASAFSVEPKLEKVQEAMDETRGVVFNSLTDADKISLPGLEAVKSETVKTILKQPRKTTIDDKQSGAYRIVKVDNSNIGHFRFYLRDIFNGEEFWAIINDNDILNKRIRNDLQEAEYNRQPILLHMEIKRKAGKITTAKILKTDRPDEKLLSLIELGMNGIAVSYNYKDGFKYILSE